MYDALTTADAIRRLAALLAERGYEISSLGDRPYGSVATRRGHSLGPFLPYTDFVFLHDLDEERIADGPALEALHQRNREHGEGQMRVSRPFRYRVPNSVTFGVASGPVAQDLISVARMSRHAANSGEKNSVFVLDLATQTLFSQGWEHDRLRYGGTWVTTINPSNRITELLTPLVDEVLRRD